MVYTGRPTTGCSRCRERRKKCDETKPNCQNCIRIGRECPGYPDQLDSMFRDETDIVTQRATSGRSGRQSRKSSTALSSPVISSRSISDPGPSIDTLSSYRDVPAVLDRRANVSWTDGIGTVAQTESNAASAMQRAVSHFWSSYASPRDEVHSIIDVLKRMLQNDTNVDEILHAACQALAMRSFANQRHETGLFKHAHDLYGQALSKIQKRIKDVAHDIAASMLMSVLLLAFFELITSPSIEDAQRHVAGAASILTSHSIWLAEGPQIPFMSRLVKGHVLINAILQRKACEDIRPANVLENHQIPDFTCAARLPELLQEADTLLGNESAAGTNKEIQIQRLLARAYEHQKVLYQHDNSMPTSFSYRSNAAPSQQASGQGKHDSVAWLGIVHVYPDVMVASVRNCSRILQLLCSQTIVALLRSLNLGSYSSDPRHQDAMYRMQYLVDDIAASVPHQLVFKMDRRKAAVGKTNKEASSVSGAYMLIWPLFVASQMPCTSEVQRKWFEGRIATIFQRYGVDNAEPEMVAADAARAYAECLAGSSDSIVASLAEDGLTYRHQPIEDMVGEAE